MKNILKFGVLLFTLFLFVACDKTPEEISDLLPDIALSGDVLTTIEVGSTYVDPGAIILGEFDLDYTTTSDLDTNTVGSYTITYSIEYLGVDYSVDRTVIVVDSVIFNLNITISDVAVTATQISFTVSFDDPNNDLNNPRVVLYQDDDLIRSYVLTTGSNVITIDTFFANTTYRVAVEGSYMYDEVLYNIEGYEVSFTSGNQDVFAQVPTLTFIDVEATHDSISYDFSITDPDSIGSITNVSLYEGETLLNDNLLLLGARYLSGLASDTTYTLSATYTYDIGDGNGVQTIVATSTIRTLVEVVPILELNGDPLLIVNKDSVFSDPGAVISNGFDLTITPTSNVDTSTVGSYIMTYTVSYNSQSYGLLRYVLVIDLSLTEQTTNSLTYTVDFMDEFDDLDNEKLSLYQGETLIESVALTNGMNTITFSSLTDDTDYMVVIEGSYTDYEQTLDISGLSNSASTLLDEPLMFTNTLEEIGVDYYSSTINVVDTDAILTSAVLTLYNDDYIASFVDLQVGDNVFYQGSLNLETGYTLKVDYSYIPIGSSEPVNETQILSTFETLPIPKPKLDLATVMVDYTYGFDYMYGIDETGFESVSVFVEIRLDDILIGTYQPSTLNFIEITGLDEGRTYTIELYVDYTHTASGDYYSDVLLDSMTRTTLGTLSYALPTIDNLVITQVLDTDNSITFNFDYTDVDDTVFGTSYLNIYNQNDQSKASQLITVGSDQEVTFSGYYIYPNQVYTIKLRTDYKVDEIEANNQWSSIVYEYSFVMKPDVEVTSLDFEQSLYFHGDQIIMKLELDNGSIRNGEYYDDVNVEYVTVNNIKYYKDDFMFPSSNQTIYLNMGVETDYTDYYYHMTDFAVTLVDESSYVIEYDQTLTFRLQQPGSVIPDEATVSVLSITTTNQTRVVSESETRYATLTIKLDNPFDLDVYSITVRNTTYLSSEFITAGTTSKQIQIPIELEHGTRSYSVSELVYLRDSVQVIAENEHYVPSLMIYGYYLEDRVEVYTANQLNTLNTADYDKFVILMADIDLTGVTFIPITSLAAFDGNGFTISNLTINSITANQSSEEFIGLFGYTFGFIYDVTLSNVVINVTTDDTKELYIGGLAGKTSGYVVDSHVIGNSSITINGLNHGHIGGLIGKVEGTVDGSSAHMTISIDGNDTAAHSYLSPTVGGLVGTYGYYSLNTSSATGSITITNTSTVQYFVGGLVGVFSNYDSFNAPMNYIFNSYAQVDISSTNYGNGAAGGLVGKIITYYNQTTILNSYASGDVFTTRRYVGGLVGVGGAWIENSFTVGSISNSLGYADRFRTHEYYLGYIFLVNCYSYDGQLINGISIEFNDSPNRLVEGSQAEYNDQDFYIRVLQWNNTFYDFSNLDIENGLLPTLK